MLLFDNISLGMLILVTSISLLVHIFSINYMAYDPHIQRFMSYLSLFTFFMIVLVTSENLIQIFIGWEGVGLCSYLLINFWFGRIQANKSAVKAVLVNKIGDIALLLAIVYLWAYCSVNNFTSIFALNEFVIGKTSLIYINLLILIGVIGKSAQIGLHMWLPDAMEGPTPVSALIHAATMVTAGVFLIIRLSPLMENTPFVSMVIILTGGLTAFISASVALTQNDLKKVIAYSTCSQLGYMILISGFSFYQISISHLINHGFFKALLFLSAGSIIHSLSDEQDFRKAGNVIYYNPITYISMLIGSLSLMGLPFITGFYSKDLILEVITQSHKYSFALTLAYFAALFTSIYSMRLTYYSFFSYPQYNIKKIKVLGEGNLYLTIPIIILAIFTITFGLNFQYYILNEISPVIIINLNKLIPFILLIFASILSITGLYFTVLWWPNILNYTTKKIYSLSNNLWYFDNVINNYIIKKTTDKGLKITYKLIDNQLLELWGPFYVKKITTKGSKNLTNIHKGELNSYLYTFLFFITITLVYFVV